MDGIADYEFVRRLGRGTHGEYYLAKKPGRLPVEAEHVAVKVIADAADDAFRRASRELNAFAAVQSPYLVPLYDAGQQGWNFYYATEYFPHGSLLDQRVPGGAQLFTALAHAARATQALHDAGMVHRDIGPGNILLAGDGGRLSDLDLTLTLDQAAEGTATMPGLGKAEFTDRALLSGTDSGQASDVWSLGATLHWVATGSGLYGDLPTSDPMRTFRIVVTTPPKVADSVDPQVAELVNACIDDADKRPSAGELADRIEALAAQQG